MQSGKSAPVVALHSVTGTVGSMIAPAFLEALKAGKIAELRVLTQTDAPELEEQGAKLFQIIYDDKSTLLPALKGVDVLVSTMGTDGDWKKHQESLLEAIVESKVKVYFPSEFGADLRKDKYNAPIYEQKKAHLEKAQSNKDLKVVALCVGIIMDILFESESLIGINAEEAKWTIVGDGNAKVATTAPVDIGHYTLAAVLLAHEHPEKCPDHLRVFSENHSLNKYADIMDSVAGKKSTIEYKSHEEALKETESQLDLGPFGPLHIAISEGFLDFTEDNHNDLLNHNHRSFTLKTVDDFARETKGRPKQL